MRPLGEAVMTGWLLFPFDEFGLSNSGPVWVVLRYVALHVWRVLFAPVLDFGTALRGVCASKEGVRGDHIHDVLTECLGWQC
jgi:hypothetical protein